MKIKKMLIILLQLTSVTLLEAQFTMKGTITDQLTGEPLPGANVLLENTFLSTASDHSGRYIIKNLKPGSYVARFSYIGYETISMGLTIRKDTVADIQMKIQPILSQEVNIIATRVQPNTPATYSTISQQDITRMNRVQDMPYVLQSTPSVVVTSDAGTGIGYTGINIRGTDLTRINVTLNGIPVNDAESQGVWFVDLPDLASSTENIEIQRGVGTSTNGAGAFGATINIQTLNLSEKPYAELNLTGGSFNTFKTNFRFGTGLISNHFSFDGRASYITSDGYIDRAFAHLQSFCISGGYLAKNTTLKFNILSGREKTYQAWEGVPKDSLATNRTYNPSGEYIDKNGMLAYYDNQTDNYTQTHYQLIFSQQIGHKLNINAALHYTKGKGYYESYYQDQAFTSYGLNNIIIGKDTITSTDLVNQKWLDNDFYGFTFSGNYSLKEKLKVTVGGAWNQYDGKNWGTIPWAEYASNSTNDWKWYDSPGRKQDFNIFTKVSAEVLPHLNLYADLQYRYVYYKLTGTLDDLRTLDQAHTFNFFNPKAGIYYDITGNNAVYFSFGTANREPSRDNYKDADPARIPTNETLYDFELGYKLKLKHFTAGLNMYYMDYHNQLVLTGQINDVGEAIMVNVPASYRAGIELSAGANIFKWLDWNITSTISVNKIRNFTEYIDSYDSLWNFTGQVEHYLGKTDLSFSPGILLTNGFIFKPVKNFNIGLTSKYVGREFIDNTSNRDRSLDPYFIQGLSADYSVKTKIFRTIGLHLTVNNVFSNKYETNGWVYPYYINGQLSEVNGYFPQALISFLFGLTLGI